MKCYVQDLYDQELNPVADRDLRVMHKWSEQQRETMREYVRRHAMALRILPDTLLRKDYFNHALTGHGHRIHELITRFGPAHETITFLFVEQLPFQHNRPAPGASTPLWWAGTRIGVDTTAPTLEEIGARVREFGDRDLQRMRVKEIAQTQPHIERPPSLPERVLYRDFSVGPFDPNSAG
jgi:hypothetical protein